LADLDPAALFAEERAAAERASPKVYLELLKARLSRKPAVLNLDLLERVVALKPWQDALREVAGPLLVNAASPPETVILVNTFPRVPTAAAETVLVDELGLRRGSLHTANGGFDNAFDRLTALREFKPKSLVRGHVMATVRVRSMVALLGIRPIVLVRDIFDTIACHADDRGDEPVAPGYRFAALDLAVRRRVRVLRMAPQLVDFYASWTAEQAIGRCVVRRWEDVRHDWPGFVAERLAEHGRAPDRDAIAARIATLPPDKHSGTVGRGETLPAEDKALVRTLYAQYPAIDFRPIDPGAPAPARRDGC